MNHETIEELEAQVEAARKEKSAAWNTMVYYRDKYNEKNDRYRRLFRRIMRARAMLGGA